MTSGSSDTPNPRRRWSIGWFPNGEYKRITEGHSRIRAACVLLICLNARPDSPHVFRWEPKP